MLLSPILESIAGIDHGFGNRDDDMTASFPTLWPERAVQHERHGTRIAVIDAPGEDCGEADGMFTERPGVLLTIATADCAPVLLARRDGAAVAALHAGWRGAMDGIVDGFVAMLGERGESPADWSAAIGPTAGACCYEVSGEVIERFRARYDIAGDLLAPQPRRLNLAGVVRWQLERAGFTEVWDSASCTMCSVGQAAEGFVYHSYRRDSETRAPGVDVQWSAIAIGGR
ncbi:polyphenol oxidase family protein [Massilia sp.]|uniref:polyphenol oxidase family protein n=1 Tax=Massilia sp. TaxID=1882437 RepID=UPI0028985E69|nr:polyphenol oxidase family protein [Massilia sp.]